MTRRSLGVGIATLAAVLGGALALQAHWRDGLTAHWWAEVEGELRFVTTVVEHRPDYPNVHRALSRVAQSWNYARDGLPRDPMPFRARLETTLEVPAAATLRLDASGRQRIAVDGEVTDRLHAGANRVTVDWWGDFDRPTHLRWEACDPDGRRCRPLDAGAFTPTRTNPAILWIALLALGLGLGLAFLLARAAACPAPHRARWLGAAALLLLLAGGGWVRFYDYQVMPELRENGDELFATWNGWQLLEDGSTVGWSMWASAYGDRVEHEQLRLWGQDWYLIRPYFEPPPLMHVLVGVAAHAGGAESFAHAKLSHTRVVPILLNLLTIALIFGLARRLEPTGPAALLAAALYAFLPTTVLQGRVVKEEALLVPMALGALWLFLRWRDDRRTRWLVGAAALAGACTLAKVPGYAFVVALTMLVAAEGVPWKTWIGAGALGTLVSLLLPLFAALSGWESFRESLHHQSARPVHFNIFSRWFDVTLINHNVIGRGWALFLWVGTAWGLATRSRLVRAVVATPLVVYMAAIAIGSGSWTFGWYSMPLVPFLCLGAGIFLAELWKKPNLLGGALLALLLVMYSLNFVYAPEFMKTPANWPFLRRLITGVVFVLLAPWALVEIWRTAPMERLARGALLASLAVYVAASVHFVTTYDVGFEVYENFDRDVYFDR